MFLTIVTLTSQLPDRSSFSPKSVLMKIIFHISGMFGNLHNFLKKYKLL